MKASSEKRKAAGIFVTKFNAARRQLDAAIRMFFSDEDVLAVHTLGTAAYRILRDLQKSRGILHYPDVLRAGLWAMAEDYEKGRLTGAPPQLLPLIQHVVELRASGTLKSATEINIGNEQMLEIDDLRKSTRAANFLKHADRDHAASLSEDEIDNVDLLMRASATYKSLLHSLTPEMAALAVYAWESSTVGPAPQNSVIARLVIETKSFTMRKKKIACRKLIKNKEFRSYFGDAHRADN
jgi:hypothetical protein